MMTMMTKGKSGPLPLNAPKQLSGGSEAPVWSRGKAPVVGLADEVPPPEAEAFCTFAPNILKNGYRKCVFKCVYVITK